MVNGNKKKKKPLVEIKPIDKKKNGKDRTLEVTTILDIGFSLLS